MKTPREILLEKHQNLEAKLDRVRRESLWEFERGSRERPHSEYGFTFFLKQLWRELILPSRHIWSSLAAAWLVILCLNLGSLEPASTAAVQKRISRAEILTAAKEHRLRLTELMMAAEPTVRESPRFVPRPRSGLSFSLKTA